MRHLIPIIAAILFFSSCDSSKMKETPTSQFVGTWKLTDRGMFDGIEMKVSQNDKGEIKGVVTRLNDDKYVQMFMEEGDLLLSGVKRNSNFEFVVSEKKIAAPLFSAYGQGTTNEFKATFKNENTILLGGKGQSGSYVRVNSTSN
ncbi:MAG: hypothetical protein HWE22_19030 [Flavobacteriales bacterium]|nr:hypothetical protein [Flavobacteriales bacterium]